MSDRKKHFFSRKNDEILSEEYEDSHIEKGDKAADIVSKDIARAIEERTGRTEKDDEKVRDYEIGGYHFETYYEYRNAEEDIKRIEIINKNIDIKDPEAAVRLYNMIRDGKIVFKSPIGEQFFNHIGDVVAERSVDLLQDKRVVDEAEGQAKNQKYLSIAIIILAGAAFSYFAYSEISDRIAARKMSNLQKDTQSKIEEQAKKGDSTVEDQNKAILKDGSGDKSKVLTVLPEFQNAYGQNPEMVGWLSIPDTDINYPVVCKENDNNYYLNHGFDNSEDKNGSIFMDYRSDIISPTTNTIIYGHHMESGMMFGTLDKYLDEEYYKAHRMIEFDTIYEKRQYQVVAVCLSDVKSQDTSDYRYYNFIQAKNQQEFDAFYNDVKIRNVFGENVDLKATDQILTLSTCNHYTEDGRQFIVAKRIDI